jgi:urease accessory protein
MRDKGMRTPSEISSLALLRLLQLASPALPVGAYAYSQGLESAVEQGHVTHANSAMQWIQGVLHTALARWDLPILWRLYHAWQNEDFAQADHWNTQVMCARETAELRAEDQHLGAALLRVLAAQGVVVPEACPLQHDTAFATAFSLAAWRWSIPAVLMLQGYAWAWLESQVAAATKLVPLGQTAAQQILAALQPDLVDVTEAAMQFSDDELYTCSFGLAILSAQHETQYSRLFRS